MRSKVNLIGVFFGILSLLIVWTGSAMAATNTAIRPAAEGFALTDSGPVTVTAATVKIIKAVLDNTNACLATSDGVVALDSCNGNKTSIQVPSGTTIKFLIYVRNDTDVQIPDVRIKDVIDTTAGAAGGFTYTAASMRTIATPLDTDTISTIVTAVTGGGAYAESDAVEATAGNYASIVGGGNLTIGAVAAQTNATLNLAARKTFALIFTATKN